MCFLGFFFCLVPLFLIARSSLGRASPQRATDPRTGGGAWPPAPDRGLYKYEASPRGGGHQALFTREEHPSGATDPQNKRRRRKAQRGRPTSKKPAEKEEENKAPGRGAIKIPEPGQGGGNNLKNSWPLHQGQYPSGATDPGETTGLSTRGEYSSGATDPGKTTGLSTRGEYSSGATDPG